VLSFSTAVDIAVSRGAKVYPCRWQDASAHEYARSVSATVADHDNPWGFSLSPASLLAVNKDTRLVLPSPNGAGLSLDAGSDIILCGCLRNCEAVADCAQEGGLKIVVIPAGERWPDGSLRPALEDLLGAGIISFLTGKKSPEALLAQSSFQALRHDLLANLMQCASGLELRDKGREQDVKIAAQINVGGSAPMLVDGAFVDHRQQCV
jgi:2-phosphosulfolactate phosphatase